MNDGRHLRRARSRSAILDAAVELVAQHGADFSMRALADRAGVAPATPFNHFESKLGLFAAVIDRSLDEIEASGPGVVAGEDPADTILRYADHVTAWYANRADVYRPVLGAVIGSASFDHPVMRRATDSWRYGLDLLAGAGALDPSVDRAMLARHLEASWIGSLLPWTRGELSGDEWRELVAFSTTIALRACTAGAGADR